MRRTVAYPLLAACAALGLLAPQSAQATRTEDPRAEREKVRAQQAENAAKLDASKASLAEVDQALDALDQNVRAEEAALHDAQQAADAATFEAARATNAVRDITKKRKVLRHEIAGRAVNAYVNPPSDDLLTMLESNDITDANNRKLYVELRAQSDADLTDTLRGLNKDLEHQRQKAAAAKERAVQKREEQKQRTIKVEQAREAKRKVAAGIQAQVNSQVAESIRLAKTDKELSAKIALQQAQLEARLAAERARQAAVQRAARSSNISSGSETAPAAPTSATPAGSGSGVSLSRVDGALINSQIAGQASAMINAARAQGVNLGINNAYRDPAQQIALRRAHCGSSYYAIYQMSPSACRPPTARPGASMHEVGLAIDFSNCSSRGSACYQWLAGHAASYGFYNLPSEPWHWSVNGH